MAVFPENMDRLNLEDPKESLAKIQDYIRYMGERIDFSFRNMTKSVSAAGISSAELYILIQEQTQALAALQSTVNSISGNVTTMQGNVLALQGTVNTIAGKVSTLESDVNTISGDISTLESDISTIQGTISTIQTTLTSLDQRVTALETPPTP